MACKTLAAVPLLLALWLPAAVAEDPVRALAPSPPAGGPPRAPVPIPRRSIGVRHPLSKVVERGLHWLKAQQAHDGSWKLRQLGRWCDRTYDAARSLLQGRGQAKHDLAVTAQAALAFLELGYTERGAHPYKSTVRRALRYLRSHANEGSGRFGTDAGQALFAHALASEAFLRRYALDGSLVFRGPTQRGLDWLYTVRNQRGVWRQRLGSGPGETRATSQVARVLLLARELNQRQLVHGYPALLKVPADGTAKLRAFLRRVVDAETGRVAASPGARVVPFRQVPSRSAPLEADAVWIQQVLASDPRATSALKRSLAHVRARPPRWTRGGPAVDLNYWLAGTQALRHVGGADFRAWQQALDRALVAQQRRQGSACRYLGSWDPRGVWGREGGRVFATATALRCLAAAHATR